MKNFRLGTNFAIFVLFFGAALFDALQTQSWLRAVVFATLAALSLWADRKQD